MVTETLPLQIEFVGQSAVLNTSQEAAVAIWHPEGTVMPAPHEKEQAHSLQ